MLTQICTIVQGTETTERLKYFENSMSNWCCRMGKKQYKIVRLDMDAYNKLKEVEELIKKEGILLDPSVSECVRWLYTKAMNYGVARTGIPGTSRWPK